MSERDYTLRAADTPREMMRAGGVYRIRNTVNNRVYIGSTVMFDKRLSGHRKSLRQGNGSPRLQNAWGKYGAGAFVFEPLFVCSRENLLKYEQLFIDHYDSANRDVGYNILPKAGSREGMVHTDEAKAKISAAMKLRKLTPEHKAKIGAALTGIPRPQWVKDKMSATKTGVPNLKARGKTRTQSHCEKISAAKRGKPSRKKGIPVSAAQLEKMKLANVGKKLTPEHKANIAAGLKRSYECGKRPKLKPGTKSQPQ